MSRKLAPRRPSPAMVIAIVALVSSLSGGAVAATLITGADIKNASIGKKDLKNNSVNTNKVKDASLLTDDFAPGVLGGGQGARGAAIKHATGPDLVVDSSRDPIAAITVDVPGNGFLALTTSMVFGNANCNVVTVELNEGQTLKDDWSWDPGDSADDLNDQHQSQLSVFAVTAGRHTYTATGRCAPGSAVAAKRRMTAVWYQASL